MTHLHRSILRPISTCTRSCHFWPIVLGLFDVSMLSCPRRFLVHSFSKHYIVTYHTSGFLRSTWKWILMFFVQKIPLESPHLFSCCKWLWMFFDPDPLLDIIIIDYYMAFFILHVISTRDIHISPIPYHNLFIIYRLWTKVFLRFQYSLYISLFQKITLKSIHVRFW